VVSGGSASWALRGVGGDVQADDTPQDDDVKVEDVRYAEREAEDYAEHAGPGDGFVSFCARWEAMIRLPAHTIVRIYL
jgi:hypothetical protein